MCGRSYTLESTGRITIDLWSLYPLGLLTLGTWHIWRFAVPLERCFSQCIYLSPVGQWWGDVRVFWNKLDRISRDYIRPGCNQFWSFFYNLLLDLFKGDFTKYEGVTFFRSQYSLSCAGKMSVQLISVPARMGFEWGLNWSWWFGESYAVVFWWFRWQCLLVIDLFACSD